MLFSRLLPLAPLFLALTSSASTFVQRQTAVDQECVTCKRVVKYVVQELSDNRTEEAIIQSLQSVCNLFPKNDSSNCDMFVEEHKNELIHILIEEGDPDLACTLLGVCFPA